MQINASVSSIDSPSSTPVGKYKGDYSDLIHNGLKQDMDNVRRRGPTPEQVRFLLENGLSHLLPPANRPPKK